MADPESDNSYLYNLKRMTYEGRMTKLLQPIMSHLVGIPEGCIIFDAGASIGISSVELASLFNATKVYSIDLQDHEPTDTFLRNKSRSSTALHLAHGDVVLAQTLLGRVELHQQDMFHMDLGHVRADLIVMANNLMFGIVDNPDVPELTSVIASNLRSAINHLNDAGYLVLSSDTILGLRPKANYIILRRKVDNIELIGDEEFYNVNFALGYSWCQELVGKLN